MECGRNGKSGGIWRETGLKPLNGFRLKGVLIDSPAHGEFLVFDCARPRALFFPPPAAIETSSEAGGIASGGYLLGVGVGIGIGVDSIRPVRFQSTYSMAARKTSSFSCPNAMPIRFSTSIPIPTPTPINAVLFSLCLQLPPASPCAPLTPRRLTEYGEVTDAADYAMIF